MDAHFSGRLGTMPDASPLSLALDAIRASGRSLVNLSDSNPSKHGLVPPGVLDALSDVRSLSYEPDPRGLIRARDALAARLLCNPERLFLSASSSEAYAWAFKLCCDPGDCVLVPRPGYPLFDWLAGLEAVRCVPYSLYYTHPYGWRIDMDELTALAAKHRPKALVVINPNNPTGSYLAQDEYHAIPQLCASFGMSLVSDEVFLPYWLDAGGPGQSMGNQDSCLTLTLDGLSKRMCLPQLKLGWTRLSGPDDLVAEAARRLELIADTYLSVGAPVMNALPTLLATADSFTDGVRRRLAQNLQTLHRLVGGPDSAFRVLRCDGGWTALLQCPHIMSDEELVLAIAKHAGVSVQPGYFFDMDRDGFVAVSLILEPTAFAQAASAMVDALKQMLQAV